MTTRAETDDVWVFITQHPDEDGDYSVRVCKWRDVAEQEVIEYVNEAVLHIYLDEDDEDEDEDDERQPVSTFDEAWALLQENGFNPFLDYRPVIRILL